MNYRFRDSIPKPGTRASVLNYMPVESAGAGTAILRLYDPIDDWGGDWGMSAKEFANALATLPADTTTIELHVNCPGGVVFEGVTIMNMLRAHTAEVVVIVDGIAASAASFIACSADTLIMGPQSQLMIHDAMGLEVGNAGDMRKCADLLDRISDSIAEVYAAKSGGKVADWRTAMLAESWYSAEEAVAAGLADSIALEDTEDPQAFLPTCGGCCPPNCTGGDACGPDCGCGPDCCSDGCTTKPAAKNTYPARLAAHAEGLRRFYGLD